MKKVKSSRTDQAATTARSAVAAALNSIRDEDLQRLWKESERPGAVFVLRIAHRPNGNGFGIDIVCRPSVEPPFTFGSDKPKAKP